MLVLRRVLASIIVAAAVSFAACLVVPPDVAWAQVSVEPAPDVSSEPAPDDTVPPDETLPEDNPDDMTPPDEPSPAENPDDMTPPDEPSPPDSPDLVPPLDDSTSSDFPFEPTAPAPTPEPQGPKVAVLRALEKITARITELDVPIGQSVQFKSLTITARTCHKRPPEDTPETTAFVEISEKKPGGDVVKLFTGWMFASSPGLSALEHPVYDVWLTDCKTKAPR